MRSSNHSDSAPPAKPGSPRRAGEMKMGDLERASGVPRSSIRAYLQMGLLRAPRRAGPRLYLFDAGHLEELARIRALRAGGRSLRAIRQRLARPATRAPHVEPEPGAGAWSRDARRARILEVATRLFASRGYDAVRLSDVAGQLGLSKAALYRYFESKEALFVECIEQIRMLVVPPRARAYGAQQQDLRRRAAGRARAVLDNFDTYRMLTNFLTMVAHGPDPALAAKARAAFHAMVTNVRPDLVIAVERGRYRADVDLDAHCYMLWGALMGAGERMLVDEGWSVEHALASYLDFIARGTLPRAS